MTFLEIFISRNVIVFLPVACYTVVSCFLFRLEYGVSDIIKINQKRWEIEECFRIMKTEFKARPVYLSRKDRITAHFTTCFTALVIYRILEHKLNEKNFKSNKDKWKIATYFLMKRASQVSDLSGLRGFYLSLTVKDGIFANYFFVLYCELFPCFDIKLTKIESLRFKIRLSIFYNDHHIHIT